MTPLTAPTEDDVPSFLDSILERGSALQPRFLLILNVVLAALFGIFTVLLVLTQSLHFVALMCIVVGLWSSVQWFLYELENAPHEASGDVQQERKDQ